MGNRALRKKLSLILKSRGHSGNLWIGSKNKGRSVFKANMCKELIRKLEYKEGDLVNDCDGFNHLIKEISFCYSNYGGSLKIFELEPYKFLDGSLSCGCSISPVNPLSVKEIERFFTYDKEYVLYLEKMGFLNEKTKSIIERVNKGEPITDENGCFLNIF